MEFIVVIVMLILMIGITYFIRNYLVFAFLQDFLWRHGAEKATLLPSYRRLLFDLSLPLDEEYWLDYIEETINQHNK